MFGRLMPVYSLEHYSVSGPGEVASFVDLARLPLSAEGRWEPKGDANSAPVVITSADAMRWIGVEETSMASRADLIERITARLSNATRNELELVADVLGVRVLD